MNSSFSRLLGAALLVLAGSVAAIIAQDDGKEENKPADPPAPKERVTKIGASTYRLGDIEFDAKSKEIRVPAVVNMREGGPIEYLLINEKGKVHEALLVTKARPLQLQIVMKLLKFSAGDGQIFDAFAPEEEQRRAIENPEKRPQGDAIRVAVTWKDEDGKEQEAPVAGWVLDGMDQTPMSDEPWIFTGSHVIEGQFLAEIDGSVIAVYLDQAALFNMTREGANQDARWGANDKAIPPIGTPVTVIFQPAKLASQ